MMSIHFKGRKGGWACFDFSLLTRFEKFPFNLALKKPHGQAQYRGKPILNPCKEMYTFAYFVVLGYSL